MTLNTSRRTLGIVLLFVTLSACGRNQKLQVSRALPKDTTTPFPSTAPVTPSTAVPTYPSQASSAVEGLTSLFTFPANPQPESALAILGSPYTVANSCPAAETGGLCGVPKITRINFSRPFVTTPVIHVSPANISEQPNAAVGTMDSLAAFATEVSPSGFTLVCSGSPNNISGAAGEGRNLWAAGACSWIAVGSQAGVPPGGHVQIYSKYQISPSGPTQCSGAFAGGYCNGGHFFNDIVFDRPFRVPPTIVVNTSYNSTFSPEGYASDKVLAFASEITERGARIWCAGSRLAPPGAPGETASIPAICDVLAVGESVTPDPNRDIDPISLVVQSGSRVEASACYGQNIGTTCSGGIYIDVRFNRPFSVPPVVHVSPSVMGTDPTVGGTTDQVRAAIGDVYAHGFRMWCSSSPLEGPQEPYVSRAACNWIAIGR